MNQNAPLILPLAEIRAADLPLAGGKGANLGELTRAGFHVPPGFCLTTVAFRHFMAACPTADDGYDLLDTIRTEDVVRVRDVGERIRGALVGVPVPSAVGDAVRAAWHSFGADHAYAVRSSATAEDLPGASFAGQQDTYLNVAGEAALLDAIRRCWISLFTDRAILYRIRNGFGHRDVGLAVIVQEMVLAEKAGTLFTADPLTGHRHMLAIDASFGLGEALVGGLVSPDTYRVDKRSRIVTNRQIADKSVGVFPDTAGGTRQIALGETQRRDTVLSDAELLALAEVGIGIENHFGAPQDIEWAILPAEEAGVAAARQATSAGNVAPPAAKGHHRGIFILQSRPITSLYPIEGLESPDGSLHVYFSLGHQQSMTRAMAPLSLSSFQLLIPIGHGESIFENTLIRASGGRMFADITTPLRHPVLRKAMLGLLKELDALAPDAARQAMQQPAFQRPHGLRLSFGALKAATSILGRVVGALLWRDLTDFTLRTNALIEEFMTGFSDRLQEQPTGRAKLQSLLDTLPETFPFFLNWVPEVGAGLAATRLLKRLAERWLTRDELEALTLGIPGNVVNEMNLAIGDLADLARDSPELAASLASLGDDGAAWLAQASGLDGSGLFLDAWDEFIDRFGARGPAEIDIQMPRWYEDPMPVLRVITGALPSEPRIHRARQAAHVQAREAAHRKLLDSAGRGLFGRLRRLLIGRLYHAMIEAGGMREHHKFVAVRILAAVKEVLKGIAAELVAADKLAQAEDVWFLTWRELLAIWDNKDSASGHLIAQRRADLARYQRLVPPLIITSDGEAPTGQYRVDDAPEGALLGNPVATGVVEGVVHVIRDPQRELLAPGEILVAEFTDPGWTPLFLNAAGLILEVGGALTHGAVVAREYGIPAVVGVRGATNALRTGQRVRVDGHRGVIEVLQDS